MGIGRPKGTKNAMRTPEEKGRIVLEALENGSKPVARRHGISESLLRTWVGKYLESGIEGLKSKSGRLGRGNGLKGLHLKKEKTREEELELEVLKLRIEVERLKKGYRVKGGGRGKGYVTTKGSNTRS